MRYSYIGEYFNTEKEVTEWAARLAECTHDHPEGIKGAVVTSMCIYMVRTDASKVDVFEYVKRQYPRDSYEYRVEYRIEDYKDTYRWDVSCQGSVPVAVRCFWEETTTNHL